MTVYIIDPHNGMDTLERDASCRAEAWKSLHFALSNIPPGADADIRMIPTTEDTVSELTCEVDPDWDIPMRDQLMMKQRELTLALAELRTLKSMIKEDIDEIEGLEKWRRSTIPNKQEHLVRETMDDIRRSTRMDGSFHEEEV